MTEPAITPVLERRAGLIRSVRRNQNITLVATIFAFGLAAWLIVTVISTFEQANSHAASLARMLDQVTSINHELNQLGPGSVLASGDPDALIDRAELQLRSSMTSLSVLTEAEHRSGVLDDEHADVIADGLADLDRCLTDMPREGRKMAPDQPGNFQARMIPTFNGLNALLGRCTDYAETIYDTVIDVESTMQADATDDARTARTRFFGVAGQLGLLLVVMWLMRRSDEKGLAELSQEREEMVNRVSEDAALLERQQVELSAYNRKLAESNRDLTDFAYVASHDLQEPLRKIIAFGDRLQTRCADELSDDGRDYLDRMQNAAARMQRLIEDLLTFSRVTTRGAAFVPTDLNHVVRGVLGDLEIAIENASATVDVRDLPTLAVDPSQFRQLTQNLIGNALKFRAPDVAPRISVFAKQLTPAESLDHDLAYPGAGGWWRITVTDNGIGFDDKYAEKIFTVFQRLHGRSEYEGSGVGLAVCRRIVERHRGTITALSQPGRGATFEIVLPVCQDDTNVHDLGTDHHQHDDRTDQLVSA